MADDRRKSGGSNRKPARPRGGKPGQGQSRGGQGRPARKGQGSKPRRQGEQSGRGQSSGRGRSGADRRDRSRSGDRDRRQDGRGRDRYERTHEGRHGKDSQARSGQRRAFSVDGGAENLPRWLKEEIQRVTPRDRQDITITLLSEAASEYADEQFRSAHRKLLKAKNMSSRASAIRELLGLTSYRLGNWDEALRELRAFRRFTGDTTHMPVEMDALRGLERHGDVEKTWDLFMELGGHPATDSEARVVYGSYLLDRGRAKDAWNATKPKRVSKDARAYELRRWFIAARAALELGDPETAATLVNAVRDGDPEMPGVDELAAKIAAR